MSGRQIAMGRPTRIKRCRTKGWRAPEGAVYVGRGSKWGNPFTVDDAMEWTGIETQAAARDYVTELFAQWLDDELPGGAGPAGTSWSSERRNWIRNHLGELVGRNLMCWCPLDAACHADVLLELAAAGGAS